MIETKGFDELRAALQRMGDAAGPRIAEAVDEAGHMIAMRAQGKAKGDLARCLELKKATTSKSKVMGTVGIRKGFSYAVPYELGHYLIAWGKPTGNYIRPRAFMRPAFDESKDEIEKIVDNAMDEILKTFGS